MDDNIRMMTVMICRIWHGRLNAMRGTTKSTVGTANDLYMDRGDDRVYNDNYQLISISGNNIVRYTREVADDILIKVSDTNYWSILPTHKYPYPYHYTVHADISLTSVLSFPMIVLDHNTIHGSGYYHHLNA